MEHTKISIEINDNVVVVVVCVALRPNRGPWPPCSRSSMITHDDKPVNRTPVDE